MRFVSYNLSPETISTVPKTRLSLITLTTDERRFVRHLKPEHSPPAVVGADASLENLWSSHVVETADETVSHILKRSHPNACFFDKLYISSNWISGQNLAA